MKGLLLRLAHRSARLYWQVVRPVTIGVRLLLVADRQVVLVKHTYQSGWQLPGGAMKRGERPDEAAVREGYEEAGARLLAPPALLGVHSSFDDGQSNHVLTYFCQAFRLERRSDRWEIAACRLFPLDNLPEDLTEGTLRRIDEYLAGQFPCQGAW
jgi:ADP-ribose pyrophosphatase YjhB (NUDIX family)